MPEYIERGELLEDIAESVVHTVRVGYPSPEVRGANKVIDRIKSAPVADVVEVVRCKDCKTCLRFFPQKKLNEEAIEVYYCNFFKSDRRPTDYCSFGKRKEVRRDE